MKKLLVIGIVIVMLVSATLTAFAAPDGFVTSPSGKPGPEIITFDPRDDECTAELIITPFAERQDLPDFLQSLIEKAYDNIVSSDDITQLNADLAQIVADMDILASNLAVSELFDIHVTGCDYHDGHTDFDVTLASDSLRNFVALLHMNQDGVWELVSDAQVTHNGEHLQFSVESFSPFAIVVDTTNSADSGNVPDTGDHSMVGLYAALMVISALALVVVLVKGKKRKTFSE